VKFRTAPYTDVYTTIKNYRKTKIKSEINSNMSPLSLSTYTKMYPSKKQIQIKKFFQPHISYLKDGIPFKSGSIVETLTHCTLEIISD